MARAFFYRSDEDRVLWLHLYAGFQDTTGGVAVTTSNSKMYDPATDATYLYQVVFQLVNQDTTNPVTVSVAIDPLGGTALAAPDIVYNNQTIAAGASTAWQGSYIINGNASIVAVAGANNDAVMFLRVAKVKDPTVS